MQKILLLVFSDINHDARLVRQINFLKKKYELIVCSYGIPPNVDKFILLPMAKLSILRKAYCGLLLLLRQYSSAYEIMYNYSGFLSSALVNESYDLIIANDIETLPLAFHLKRNNSKILFDAHEYAPKHFEDKFWWRIFFQPFNIFFCNKYIPKVHGMTTIGEGLATEYQKNFKIKPVVITNASVYYDTLPTNTDSKAIKLVHHGIVNRSRKIELIIGMIDFLPENFTLDLMLIVPGRSSKQLKYLEELKELSKTKTRVRFIEPVTSDKINSVLKNFDLGIILAPPINFNYSNGLPNKLYDYVQARLGVVTGPTPEIANIVKTNRIGVVADSFTSASMAKKLFDLNRKEIQGFKENSNKIAWELSSNKNETRLQDLISSILK